MDMRAFVLHQLAGNIRNELMTRREIDAGKKVGVAPRTPPSPDGFNPTVYVTNEEIMRHTGFESLAASDYETLRELFDEVHHYSVQTIPEEIGSDRIAGVRVRYAPPYPHGPVFKSLEELKKANLAELTQPSN
jgi:hypothetical protein